MKSFEGQSLERADLERIHKKALEALDRSRFKEEDFIDPVGPYSKGAVTRDLEYVDRQEHKFEKDTEEERANKQLADIFEAIILEHGELSDWFGSNAVTFKTSRYDDYENGVDTVIEFQDEDSRSASYLGLAADITFTRDTTKKFDRIKSQIDKGILARVKYFHSEHMNIHGQLSKLPEVIVGAHRKTVLELAEHWISGENSILGKHRIQIMILRQMSEQLKTFALYADSIGKKEIATIYRDRLEVVDEILRNKQGLEVRVGYEVNEDPVHFDMMLFLNHWRDSIEREIEAA
jgi:hypothetical protein